MPELLADTTGLILAGGLGRRMGGVDKGLQQYAGRPLVAHVIERLRPQVGTLMVNANRHIDAYRQLGHPVITDEHPDFPGPLAGLHAGLGRAKTPYVLTVPCDSPHLPLNLAWTLRQYLEARQLPLVYARCDGKAHPVFCLCRCSLLPALSHYLESGGRRVLAWCDEQGGEPVDFPGQSECFANFNTLAELQTPQRDCGNP